MRKYIEFIKTSFKELLAYRVFYFTGITQRLLGILIQLFLWHALLGQSGSTTSSVGTISLGEMTTYVILSSMISAVLVQEVVWDINSRVRNGQISTDLIKPMNFMAYMFSRMMGQSTFRLLFQMVPVLVVAIIFTDIQAPDPTYFLFFLLSIVNGYIIMFFLTFIMGLISFWYMQMWQIDQILRALISLFSGTWIPLWFFPEAFNTVSAFLPFRLMFYMPISIYLGKLEYGECWFAILQGIIWAGILYGVARLVWNAAMKKLVIQGG